VLVDNIDDAISGRHPACLVNTEVKIKQ